MPLNNLFFLYNVRHTYPNPDDQLVQLDTDFDDPAAIEWMVKHLKNLSFKNVVAIEADEKAYLELYKRKDDIDLVFNFAEGLHGNDRECHFPAMLEMLRLPYTGCSPLSSALILNKAAAKNILFCAGLPVLPQQVFRTGDEELKGDLKFPMIVKPVAQGSSAGISNKSVVNDAGELKERVEFIIKHFSQDALVEPFLTGREFSVPMLGNPPEILPIIESDHSTLPAGYNPLDSLEVKWIIEEKTGGANFICPAKLDADLEKKIKNICFETWKALDVLDFCRVDIRCDKNNNPFVLEVNSPAGLIPPEVSMTSYFPLSARKAGLDYETLLCKIISAACSRYGIEYN